MAMLNRILRYYTMFIVTHCDEHVAANIQSKQETMHSDKHTRTMKDDYNFLIQVYIISDPDEQFGGFNSTSKGIEHHQGRDGYILNTNQSVVGLEVMKLLKDIFNDEIVNYAVCKSLDAYVLAGL
eukprot:1277066-Ditylum_brightwellii.AAC.1